MKLASTDGTPTGRGRRPGTDKQARKRPGSSRTRVEPGKSAGTAGRPSPAGSDQPTAPGCADPFCDNEVEPGKEACEEHREAYRAVQAEVGPPEDGAALLGDVERAIRRYCVLPSEDAYVADTLWTAATHGIKVWNHATRLIFVSPERRCGKTRAMEVCGLMGFRSQETSDSSVAALYRLTELGQHTILHDEADRVFSPGASDASKEEKQAFFNAGFNRNKKVLRVLPNGAVKGFRTFAMVAFTSIKDLPDTIMDRGIVIRMRRRASNEKVDQLRLRDEPALRAIGKRLQVWVLAQLDELAAADPATPLEDRAADAWEPLLAIADLAGGDWPERAREAAVAMTAYEETMEREPTGQRLLADVRRLWPLMAEKPSTSEQPDRVGSAILVQRLNEDEESGWAKFARGVGLDATTVADLLQPYEIRPRLLAFGKARKRGYRLADFEKAWERYLPADGGR